MTDNTAMTRRHSLLIDGRPATDAEYTRIVNAKPKPAQRPVHGSLSSNRGFRLLR